MSGFHGHFIGAQIGWENGRALWVTVVPLYYSSTHLGRTMVIPGEFVTDLASVPRLPLAYLLAGGRGTRSATLHDFPYQFGFWLDAVDGVTHIDVDKQTVDTVFHESLLADPISGAGRVSAWQMWAAVRVGGRGIWSKGTTRSEALNPEWSSDPRFGRSQLGNGGEERYESL